MLDPRANELGILAYLLRTPDVVRLHGDQLQDYHFQYEPARILFRILQRGAELPVMPSYMEFARELASEGLREGWSALEVAEFHTDLRELFELEVGGFTGDYLQRFFLGREAQKVVADLLATDPAELLEALPGFRERLDTMALMGGRDEDLGVFPLSPEALQDPKAWLADMYGGDPTPTGWGVIDACLRGGIWPGELLIIMAATGVGKTLAMLNMAAACIESGRRCIYYSIDQTQAEALERFWTRFGALPIGQNISGQEYAAKLLHAAGGGHTRFLLKTFAPNRVTARDLQRHFRKARDYWYREDRRAGMSIDEAGRVHEVFIDYGDQVRPQNRKDARRFELSEIYLDFVGWGREERTAMVSATQGNRTSMMSDLLNLSMVSEDIGKVQHASHVIAVCQTALERGLNHLRLAQLKIRRPVAPFYVECSIDRSLQTIRERPEARPITIDQGGSPSTKTDRKYTQKAEKTAATKAGLEEASALVRKPAGVPLLLPELPMYLRPPR